MNCYFAEMVLFLTNGTCHPDSELPAVISTSRWLSSSWGLIGMAGCTLLYLWPARAGPSAGGLSVYTEGRAGRGGYARGSLWHRSSVPELTMNTLHQTKWKGRPDWKSKPKLGSVLARLQQPSERCLLLLPSCQGTGCGVSLCPPCRHCWVWSLFKFYLFKQVTSKYSIFPSCHGKATFRVEAFWSGHVLMSRSHFPLG